MKRILLGKSGGKNVYIDLDILLATRLLVQANSGGGKSYTFRRILEQAFGKVQCVVIDPADEFSSLREKFGFVLVGEGGETPMDIRSAALVATKLLELKASAVCNLYGLKPHERHIWVQRFLEAVMNAPKKLWHPVIFAVDEAHKFCPESGEGESAAKEYMLSLASDGRKYGFCAAFATQRLSKLDKTAAAELLNVLIGPTFIDVDLERAHKALGIIKADKAAFNAQMKTVDPGNFWALGRAISKERILVKIGGIETSHPKAGDTSLATTPPPTPDKIKSLLPKLADLPQHAEEKAKTEKELRAENRQLKADLAAAKKQQPPLPPPMPTPAKQSKPKIEVVTRPVLTDKQCESLGKKIDSLIHYTTAVGSIFGDIAVKVVAGNDTVRTLLQRQASEPASSPTVGRDACPLGIAPKSSAAVPRPRVASHVSGDSPSANGDYRPGKCERELMRVLSQFQTGITFAKLSLCSGYSQTSSSFTNALGALRSNGIITGSNIDLIRPTSRLEEFGPFDPMPYGRDLVNHWLNFPHFGLAERAVLKALVDNPDGLDFEPLAAESRKPDGSSYSPTSSSYTNALGALRTAGLIQGRNSETIRPSDDLLEALQS